MGHPSFLRVMHADALFVNFHSILKSGAYSELKLLASIFCAC